MNFKIERKMPSGSIVEEVSFSGSFSLDEILSLRLDKMDKALIDDIDSGAGLEPQDYLLALEMLFRRHAEQHRAPAQSGLVQA